MVSKISLKKRGATEWTVGKLMTIILLIAVVALVIYGVSVGAMSPLIQKTKGLFDSALISIGVKNANTNTSYCNEINIDGVGKGNFCINEKECKVDTLIGSYSINANNQFQEFSPSNNNWLNVKYFSLDCTKMSLDSLKNYNLLYFSMTDYIVKKLGITTNTFNLGGLYQKYGTPGSIEVYNDPAKTGHEKMSVTWDGYGWYVDGVIARIGVGSAVSDLANRAHEGYNPFDDKVYYKTNEMSSPAGISNLIGGDDRLNPSRAKALESQLQELQKTLQTHSLSGIYSKIKPFFDKDNLFVFNGKTYSVTVEQENPVIFIFKNTQTPSEVYNLALRNEEFVFVVKENGAWKELMYPYCYFSALKDTESIYQVSKIYEFLYNQC